MDPRARRFSSSLAVFRCFLFAPHSSPPFSLSGLPPSAPSARSILCFMHDFENFARKPRYRPPLTRELGREQRRELRLGGRRAAREPMSPGEKRRADFRRTRESVQGGTEGGTADGEVRIRRSIRTLHKNDRRRHSFSFFFFSFSFFSTHLYRNFFVFLFCAQLEHLPRNAR